MLGKRKKNIEVTEINEYFIVIGDDIFHKHDEAEERRLVHIIHDLIRNNSNLVHTNLQLVSIVDRLTNPQSSGVQLVLTSSINNSNYKIMSLTLASNQLANGRIALVDKDTQAKIDATFANVSFAGTNDAAFTVTQDPNDPNAVQVKGVAEGSGQVTGTADATYTDANTGQSVTTTVNVTVDVSVTPVAPQPQNVELQLNFDAPQNQ
jgi:hypothetical protein